VRPGVPRLYKSAFKGRRINPHIYFEAIAELARYTVSLNNSLENPSSAWQYKTEEVDSRNRIIMTRGIRSAGSEAKNKERGLAALKSVTWNLKDPASILLHLLADYAIFAPNTLVLRGLIADPQTRMPVGLWGGRVASAARELKYLKNDSDFIDEYLGDVTDLIDWISDYDVSTSVDSLLSSSVARQQFVIRFKDRFMREKKNVLTAYDASEGALYILFNAVLALHPQAPQCLAIDNLDQSLNPRLAQQLIKMMCKWILNNKTGKQILFTSHNPALLDGLPLRDDRVRLFSVDRNSEGYTVVKRVEITEELCKLSEKKGWPLSRLWVMGHLGGVPNV
jgi:hypothetical protein